ncbi:MAG: TRAM domain-containing protein [Candidatus Aquicultorales bacterium]
MVEFIRFVFVVVLTIGGYLAGSMFTANRPPEIQLSAIIPSVIIGAGVGYVSGGVAGRRLTKTYAWFETRVQNISFLELALATGGLLIGLILALIISIPFGVIAPFLQFAVALIAFSVFGFFGVRLALSKGKEVKIPWRWSSGSDAGLVAELATMASDKILDTSAIIDGRIADIARTALLEGRLVVPRFVLRELQTVADSEDQLKRNRGRRGLDILKTLQREATVKLEILERDYPELADVDAKLVKLATDNGGTIITNDYNLNKVADLQGISVINLNEVANYFRPVVLPGERMAVDLIKEGKESGQGIGYLDDGTMVVVEGGGDHLGEEVDVQVTSVLQTSAGRMIFSKVH